MIEELTHAELLDIRLALENKRIHLARPGHDVMAEDGCIKSRTVDLLIEKARLENLRVTLRQRQGFERQLTSHKTGFTRAL